MNQGYFLLKGPYKVRRDEGVDAHARVRAPVLIPGAGTPSRRKRGPDMQATCATCSACGRPTPSWSRSRTGSIGSRRPPGAGRRGPAPAPQACTCRATRQPPGTVRHRAALPLRQRRSHHPRRYARHLPAVSNAQPPPSGESRGAHQVPPLRSHRAQRGIPLPRVLRHPGPDVSGPGTRRCRGRGHPVHSRTPICPQCGAEHPAGRAVSRVATFSVFGVLALGALALALRLQAPDPACGLPAMTRPPPPVASAPDHPRHPWWPGRSSPPHHPRWMPRGPRGDQRFPNRGHGRRYSVPVHQMGRRLGEPAAPAGERCSGGTGARPRHHGAGHARQVGLVGYSIPGRHGRVHRGRPAPLRQAAYRLALTREPRPGITKPRRRYRTPVAGLQISAFLIRSPDGDDQRRRSRFGPGSAADQAIACPYQVALGTVTRQWITSLVE